MEMCLWQKVEILFLKKATAEGEEIMKEHQRTTSKKDRWKF